MQIIMIFEDENCSYDDMYNNFAEKAHQMFVGKEDYINNNVVISFGVDESFDVPTPQCELYFDMTHMVDKNNIGLSKNIIDMLSEHIEKRDDINETK